MTTLDGSWFYESYCASPGGATKPPLIAAPWSPRGQLNVATHPGTGSIKGTLRFAPGAELNIRGSIIPAADGLPEGIELIGEGMNDSLSMLRGYFVYGASVVIVGTVVALRNDPGKRPPGTSGPFVIFPSVGG